MGNKKPVIKGFWQRPATELAVYFAPELANNNSGYIEVKRSGKMILLHRWLWKELVGDIPEGMEIDHINGVRTDNRIENLRLVTRKTNMQNQKQRSDNNSGVTGVAWTEPSKMWRARWYENGKLKSKCFHDFDEAVEYRKLKISELNSLGEKYTERHGV